MEKKTEGNIPFIKSKDPTITPENIPRFLVTFEAPTLPEPTAPMSVPFLIRTQTVAVGNEPTI